MSGLVTSNFQFETFLRHGFSFLKVTASDGEPHRGDMSHRNDCTEPPPEPGTPFQGKAAPAARRQRRILERLQETGMVTIEDLASRFQVTPQTIRRDIKALSRSGWVHRYHGGAVLTSSTENVAYPDRKVFCLEEKKSIARIVARQIPDRASLFINIGTTTEEIARALRDHQGLKVITNNLNVATILSGNENFEVIVAGGLLRHRDGGIVGPLTIDFIQGFKVDFGLIGISGIDVDGTLLDFDYREVRVTRAIIENSRKTFLAADHTKFGRNAMVRLGSIEELDAVFTDRPPPKEMMERFEGADVRLHVARR